MTDHELLQYAGKLAVAVSRLLGPPNERGERRIDPFAIGDRLTELAMALDEYDRAVIYGKHSRARTGGPHA